MKPNSPQQLARLLDQIGGSYPNGIPVRALVASATPEVQPESLPRYHFFVVGEPDLSPASSALLEGIATKGLRLSADEYRVSLVSDAEVAAELTQCASERVIIFGASSIGGVADRSFGDPALMTHSLERFSQDPTLKKELWRSLQGFLTPS